ncbi:MAG: protein kinase [Proteobacteria bacterium]|nr:protein kinase [Pseudomonadota bacterium]
MGETNSDLAGLIKIHELEDMAQIRALWRRGIATLAAVASEHQPVPLEGLGSGELLAGVRMALSSGLLDDLDFLSPPAAALATFELASALPRSEEKRDLGRRVLRTLRSGNAETFVALATALALGSSRGLSGPQIRARLSLSLFLPVELSTRADVLALALISHRDSERQWLSLPSTSSLPARRLAARLLERAAREAARRAAVGDDAGLQAFRVPSVATAFERLLADRESLVWRHVAVARGLLSEADRDQDNAIEDGLSDHTGPAEWRRSVASLAARVAIEPDPAIARCRDILASEFAQRDSGVAAAMIAGLAAAGEAEIEATDEILGDVIDSGDIEAIEALADVRRERIGCEFGTRAAAHARASLLDRQKTDDDGRGALREALYAELSPADRRIGGLGQDALLSRLRVAHCAFAKDGPTAARTAADEALEAAIEIAKSLERTGDDTPEDRTQAFLALRELDHGLLESTVLHDLITVTQTDTALEPLTRLYDQLGNWLLSREADAGTDEDGEIAHPLWRLRRMRALLHLVDADGTVNSDRKLRDRRMRTANVLLTRVSKQEPEVLRHTVCAALARTGDALVREELCELSDVFISVAVDAVGSGDMDVLGEASMEPTFKQLVGAYLEAGRAVAEADTDSTRSNIANCLEALRTLAHAVPTAQSPRVEALRVALLGFSDALVAVSAMRSLSAFADDTSSLGRLESSTEWLAQLVFGATRRLGRGRRSTKPQSGEALRNVDAALERAIRGDTKGLSRAVSAATKVLRVELPPVLANSAALVLARVASLPASAQARASTEGLAASVKNALRMVPWLPLGRTLGGFYILHAIGRGDVGSVFAARQARNRDDESAESFALKVPEYHGAAAHSLSETQFYDLFCEQAKELSNLPEHPNLARFVTFDAKHRPKPFLIMELVSGPTIERVLEREELSMAEVFTILDGIASGLEAMHGAGIAHLDVNPANVVLRNDTPRSSTRPDGDQENHYVPVLVDYGLAGRTLRPGCAAPHYGAPEIWRTDLDAESFKSIDPRPADVYAFSALAFQLLTSELLFPGDNAVDVVSAHLSHDGTPRRIQALGRFGSFMRLAETLSAGLRQRPEDRAEITRVRSRLLEIAPKLTSLEWPLVIV